MAKIIYAESVAGDRTTMRAWDSAEQKDSATGRFGDELDYCPTEDTFEYALGSGLGPTKTVPNPVPGDPLAGARLVADMADADWAQ